MAGLNYILFLAGIFYNTIQYAGLLFFFGGTTIPLIRYRNSINKGSASFAQLFKAGMLMTLCCSILYSVFLIIFLETNQSALTGLQNLVMTKFSGMNITPAQMENGHLLFSIILSPVTFGINKLIANIFEGALFCLICSAILAKAVPATDKNQNAAQPQNVYWK